MEQVLEFLRMHVSVIRRGRRRLGALFPCRSWFPGKRYARNSLVATSAEEHASGADVIQSRRRQRITPGRARRTWKGPVTVHLAVYRTQEPELRAARSPELNAAAFRDLPLDDLGCTL
jgi:hypothetical protein